jgi:hypothetical protein
MAGHIALVVASADKLEVTAGPWDWDMLGLSWFSMVYLAGHHEFRTLACKLKIEFKSI